MTKRELLAAIVEAPDDAVVYIDQDNGTWRSTIDINVYLDGDDGVEIVLSITEEGE